MRKAAEGSTHLKRADVWKMLGITMIPHAHRKADDEPIEDPDTRVDLLPRSILAVEVQNQALDEMFMRQCVVCKDQAIRNTSAKGYCKVMALALKFRRLVPFSQPGQHDDSHDGEK